MSYYQIGKFKVTNCEQKLLSIQKPFLDKLSAQTRILMKIEGHALKENEELQKITLEGLRNELRLLSEQEFIAKWVSFHYLDRDAQCKAWETLSDYFTINCNGFISDLRDFNGKLVDSYTGGDISFPEGERIELHLYMQSRKNLWTKFTSHKTLRKQINLLSVIKISGTIDHFCLETNDETMIFGQEIFFSNK